MDIANMKRQKLSIESMISNLKKDIDKYSLQALLVKLRPTKISETM